MTLINTQKQLSQFQNIAPLLKTLSLGLKPIGKTAEYLAVDGHVLNSEQRTYDNSRKLQLIMDEYHKFFLNSVLSDLETVSPLILDNQLIELFYKENKDDKELVELDKLMLKTVGQVTNAFSQNPIMSKLDKADFIREILPSFVTSDKDKILLDEFSKQSSLFTNYYKIRNNMYGLNKDSGKTSLNNLKKNITIPNRCILDNLPIFLNNCKVFCSVIEYIDTSSIIKIDPNFKKMFKPENFNLYLTQYKIDLYNAILGGVTVENGENHKGLIQLVHEYNKHNKENNEGAKRLPIFVKLKKQILSAKNSFSFVDSIIHTDAELIDSIKNYIGSLFKADEIDCTNYFQKVSAIMKYLTNFDTSKIFVEKKSLSKISKAIFKDWSLINQALIHHYKTEVEPEVIGKGASKWNAKFDKWEKNTKYFSLDLIQIALNLYQTVSENDSIKNNTPNIILDYFSSMGNLASKSELDLVKLMEANFKEFNDFANSFNFDSKINSENSNINIIKQLMDSFTDFSRFVKLLRIKEKDVSSYDLTFYSEYESILTELVDGISLYNKCRNYITKKPYSKEKFTCQFGYSTFMGGWDADKLSDYGAILFTKGDSQYLGIVPDAKVFKNTPEAAPDEESYDRMLCKMVGQSNKMLPKIFFAKSFLHPQKEGIFFDYKLGKHKFPINDLEFSHKLIDYYKDAIKSYPIYNVYSFNFKPTNEYKSVNEFYTEVEDQGLAYRKKSIPASFIDESIENGNLYLFQIYTRDMSPKSKGKPDLFTLYWKYFFSDENMKNLTAQICGGAKVFFRRKSILKPTIHKKNEPIVNKNLLGTSEFAEFDYDIIKDRRFTVDQFIFNIGIKFNRKAPDNLVGYTLNKKVQKFVSDNDNNYIIGINRGERNLIYVTVIDEKGNIIEQRSLNQIPMINAEKTRIVDYNDLLNRRMAVNLSNKENWLSSEGIKNLKEGYISVAIHEIVKLLEQYPGLIVLEDLDDKFIQSRASIEKQIYQMFEDKLSSKLSYLVNKEQGISGISNALQLTMPKKGNYSQNGFLLFVPAWATSKVDPTTGYMNYCSFIYENLVKAKRIVETFESIKFNTKHKYFEFLIDYKPLVRNNRCENYAKSKWTICSGNSLRSIWDKTKSKYENINVNDILISLFDKYSIDYKSGNDIVGQLLSSNSAELFKTIFNMLNTLNQIVYFNNDNNGSYILSPILNTDNKFYDSRLIKDNSYPKCGDSNSAYHTALKGLYFIKSIKEIPNLPLITLANGIQKSPEPKLPYSENWANFILK